MSAAADFFDLSVPFLKHLGVKAEMAEGGRSRISLELCPELMNSFEVSHGGGIMTVDMSLSFIRSAKGRIVSDDLTRWPPALKEIKYRETVANGLAAAPTVFIDLLKGGNFGKQLVKLI